MSDALDVDINLKSQFQSWSSRSTVLHVLDVSLQGLTRSSFESGVLGGGASKHEGQGVLRTRTEKHGSTTCFVEFY